MGKNDLMRDHNIAILREGVLPLFKRLHALDQEMETLRADRRETAQELAGIMDVNQKELRAIYNAWKDRMGWDEQVTRVSMWLDVLFPSGEGEDGEE